MTEYLFCFNSVPLLFLVWGSDLEWLCEEHVSVGEDLCNHQWDNKSHMSLIQQLPPLDEG